MLKFRDVFEAILESGDYAKRIKECIGDAVNAVDEDLKSRKKGEECFVLV